MRRFEHGGDIFGNPDAALDFSVSTNPLGMPEVARDALISRMDEFNRYPDPECRDLCAAIAETEGIPNDWVLCGNGAADLIYRLCYAAKPREALVCAPTFSEYERALEQVDCRVAHHLLTPKNGFALTDAILEQLIPELDMLFVCNPNNPTGRLIPCELIERVLNRAKQNGTIIVVDECFLEFTDGVSSKKRLADMPKLIVLKAFTKFYAMAGLRLGYLLTSDRGLKREIDAAGQCWSVSAPAQIAGVAALTCAEWAQKTRRLAAEEFLFLSESLKALGITVFPSDANFLLFRSEKPLYEPLLQKGILIRKCENFIGLDSTYYRAGIKKREENSHLVQAIKEALHG